MARRPRNSCLGTAIDQVRKFLKEFDARLVEADLIVQTIRGVAEARGEEWPWIPKWIEEEGPRWVNDRETVTFEVPLETLNGRQCLHFTQEVWMLQPSLFGYMVWGNRAFVRMWWNTSRSAFPGQGTWGADRSNEGS